MRVTGNFAAIEIIPLVALDAENCVIPCRLLDAVTAVAHEPAFDEDTEIACWRICGRRNSGDSEDIAECRSEDMARMVAAALAASRIATPENRP